MRNSHFFYEIEIIHEKKPFVEQLVEVHEEKIENEVTIVPVHTLPEMVENKNPPSNHQLSNSFASYNSLSNLEVDEGEDKCHPLKMFFQD